MWCEGWGCRFSQLNMGEGGAQAVGPAKWSCTHTADTCCASYLPARISPLPLSSCPQDDFFPRYLVKNNVFEPVMTAFFENGDRYNMLNSATLDLVEYIKKENMKVGV